MCPHPPLLPQHSTHLIGINLKVVCAVLLPVVLALCFALSRACWGWGVGAYVRRLLQLGAGAPVD